MPSEPWSRLDITLFMHQSRNLDMLASQAEMQHILENNVIHGVLQAHFLDFAGTFWFCRHIF